MKRLAVFARSVIPEDPTQLLFLCGSVLLFICMQLRCFPVVPDPAFEINRVLGLNSGGAFGKAYESWMRFSIFARFPIEFAGGAGFFICLWPGTRPVRRILGFVCLPALAGFITLCVRFLYVARDLSYSYVSVLQRGSHNQEWALKTIWSLGPAVRMSALGIALVLVFLSRLAMGLTSLPLTLPSGAEGAAEDDKPWKRIQVVIWLSIVGSWLIAAPVGLLTFGGNALLSRFLRLPSLVLHVEAAIPIAVLGGIAAWAAGADRWKELRGFVRWPMVNFAALGIVLPTAVNSLPNLIAYLSDRIAWAGAKYQHLSPPDFAGYFRLPEPFFFWQMIGAGFEEVIWRGYLQPRFVRRYGIARGVFLLGLVWSAFHFLGDFQRITADYEVIVKLVMRLGFCVTMSYVLAWLTLKCGSIWPAVLAHGLHNVWADNGEIHPVVMDSLVRRVIVIVCWGVLGFVLFRYWPPTVAGHVGEEAESGEPEAAT